MSLLYTNSVYKVWIFQKNLRICGFSAWGARFLRHETARPVAKTAENLYNINQTCMEQYRKGGGNMDYYKAALELHEQHKGKIEVTAKVPVKTRDDLSAAYTPGVAEPCREIAKDPAAAYTYTAKGNLVAVVTNGTAVLGLGDIGAAAAMPVMEGKAILFKEFGGVDAFPICLDTKDPEQVIEAVRLLAPTFGGVNLEDISSPNCFYIEETLEKELDIPVFHDDQHGTAIVVTAALLGALRVVKKEIGAIRVVVNGPGAAGTAIIKMLLAAGVRDVIACDENGILYKERGVGIVDHKEMLCGITNKSGMRGTLADAVKGADVFIGAGDGPHHGAGCHCIRHGQPRAGDHTRGGQGGGRARDGHGPQRLSQPDQQRAGVSRCVQGRAFGARAGHQQRHEGGRSPRHRGSCQRRRTQ